MVVLARLDYVRTQISCGCAAHFTCCGSFGEKSKIKVILDHDAPPTPPHTRTMLLSALQVASDAVTCAVTTDRGHRHSKGKSEVCFWLRSAQAGFVDDAQRSSDERLPDATVTEETTHASPNAMSNIMSSLSASSDPLTSIDLVGAWIPVADVSVSRAAAGKPI